MEKEKEAERRKNIKKGQEEKPKRKEGWNR
jgi:hypothetical protein